MARLAWTGLAAALALLAPAAAGAAQPWDLAIEAGASFLVSGNTFDGGGGAIAGAMTWPVDAPRGWPALRFGIGAFLDDVGENGPPALAHRDAWGAGWRMESTLATRGRWEAGADAAWNYYRIEDDVLGEVRRGLSSTGFSLGVSGGRTIGNGQSLALVMRYHRLFNDVTGRYVTAAVEWRRRGAREGSR